MGLEAKGSKYHHTKHMQDEYVARTNKASQLEHIQPYRSVKPMPSEQANHLDSFKIH
jgi:hypothetical protein